LNREGVTAKPSAPFDKLRGLNGYEKDRTMMTACLLASTT